MLALPCQQPQKKVQKVAAAALACSLPVFCVAAVSVEVVCAQGRYEGVLGTSAGVSA